MNKHGVSVGGACAVRAFVSPADGAPVDQGGGPGRFPRYRCPSCAAMGLDVPRSVEGDLRCTACGQRYPVVDGIARLLTEAEHARYAPFLAQYRRVRAAEGWAVDAATLRALPYVLPDSPHSRVWRRRAWSYERLLACLAAWWTGRRLDVVDLGAGNCWLSSRLASLGHRLEAVDINDDVGDGLGSARHEAVNRIQASIERLPHADAQFDLAVATASLHYARDLAAAVREAARVLRPGGALVVLDTPIYSGESAGRAAAQREAVQRRRLGSDGAGTAGPGYVERAVLRRCMEESGLDYAEVPLHDSLRALLGRARRAARRLFGRPERGQMPLVVGRKRG